MELKDLIGKHTLDAVDFSNEKIKTCGDEYQACQISRVANVAECISASFPRPLTLLRGIQSVLDEINREKQYYLVLLQDIKDTNEKLVLAGPDFVINNSEDIKSKLFNAQVAVNRYSDTLQNFHCSLSSQQIVEDDCIVEACAEQIALIDNFQNALETLRWTISEYDASNSKIVGKFRSTNDLMSFLDGR